MARGSGEADNRMVVTCPPACADHRPENGSLLPIATKGHPQLVPKQIGGNNGYSQ